MSVEYFIVNKYIAAAKVSAAFALIAFFLTLFTGLIFKNYITYVFLRASIAMLLFGVLGYILGYLLANTFTRKLEDEIHDSQI